LAPTQKQVVDWQALIVELRGSYRMTWRDIGEAVDVNQHTVRSYSMKLTTPKHRDGEAIILLWMRITGKSRDVLPLEVCAVSYRRRRL
jgi:hypothetical protein